MVDKPKKVDRRIARTRRSLKSALIELAAEKSYEQISIRDLTHRADIGYATFFRHFRSKDELATYCVRAVISEFFREIETASTLHEECFAVFASLKEHQDVCLFGLSLPRDHPALTPVFDDILKWVATTYAARDEVSFPFDVAANHLINSALEMTRWWLTDGQDYSFEQMSVMLSDLVIKVTESVALEHRTKSPRG